MAGLSRPSTGFGAVERRQLENRKLAPARAFPMERLLPKRSSRRRRVDGRDKPGHDVEGHRYLSIDQIALDGRAGPI